MLDYQVRSARAQLFRMIVSRQYRTRINPASARRFHVVFHVTDKNCLVLRKAMLGNQAAHLGAFIPNFNENMVKVRPEAGCLRLHDVMVTVNTAQQECPQPMFPAKFEKLARMRNLGNHMPTLSKRVMKPFFKLRYRHVRHIPVVKPCKRQTKLAPEPVQIHLRDPRFVEDVIAGFQYSRQIVHQCPRPIEDDVPYHAQHCTSIFTNSATAATGLDIFHAKAQFERNRAATPVGPAFRMKFAICNEVFESWDLEKTFEFVADVGYDAVEISPFTIAPRVTDVSASQRSHIRDLAKRAGLEIAGIHWVLAKTEGFHVTHPDESVRARTARYCEELVRFCSDLGGRIIVFGSPKQRSKLPGVTSAQAWAWAVETLTPAVRLAQTRKVTICFEPLSPAETDFINTADEAIKFARTFDSPAARIILDVKAMCSESRPIPEIIRTSAPHFAHFHANDRNLKGPGFGDVDFRPIAAALRKVGYSGYVSVEVFDFSDGPETIATRSLSYLKEVFGGNPQRA